MKVILIMFFALFLMACSQSGNSTANSESAKANKLNPDVFLDFSTFREDMAGFALLVTSNVSGDNTFARTAELDFKENCEIASSSSRLQFDERGFFEVSKAKLSGEKCPILLDSKATQLVGPIRNENEVAKSIIGEWDSSYLIQSKYIQLEYGFSNIYIKLKNEICKDPKKLCLTKEAKFTRVDGSVVTISEGTTFPESASYYIITMGGNTLEYSSSIIPVANGNKTIRQCILNGVELTKSVCKRTSSTFDYSQLRNIETKWWPLY